METNNFTSRGFGGGGYEDGAGGRRKGTGEGKALVLGIHGRTRIASTHAQLD